VDRQRTSTRAEPQPAPENDQNLPDDRRDGGYLGRVAESPRLITAAELDDMTPNERARTFNERVVTDWEQVPEDLRQSIATTAAWLTKQRPAVESPPDV
jgi:hypothetical protein